MRRLLVLPLLLVLAACGTAGARTAKLAAPEPSVVTAMPVTVGSSAVVPFPLDGVFVYEPDTRCLADGIGSALPELPVMICMRSRALEYLTREVQAGRVKPGPKFNACTYPSDPNWSSCIEWTIRNAMPEIRLGRTPTYGTGAIGGVEYVGCAAGWAHQTYVRVSIADLPRSYKLAGWEPTNSALNYVLDLATSADGPIVGAATNYAAAACGV